MTLQGKHLEFGDVMGQQRCERRKRKCWHCDGHRVLLENKSVEKKTQHVLALGFGGGLSPPAPGPGGGPVGRGPMRPGGTIGRFTSG